MSGDVDYTLIGCYLLVAATFHVLLGYWVSRRAAVVIHRKLENGEFDVLINCFLDKHGVNIIENALAHTEPRLSSLIDDKIRTIGPVIVEQVKGEFGAMQGKLLGIASGVARKDRKGRSELAEELLDTHAPELRGLMEAAGLDVDPEMLLKYGPRVKEKLAQFVNNKGRGLTSNTPNSITTPAELDRYLHG